MLFRSGLLGVLRPESSEEFTDADRERLDALAARTNRSRGAYLRMALWAALPSLERMHWEQVAADTTGVTVTKTATFIRQRPPKPQLD